MGSSHDSTAQSGHTSQTVLVACILAGFLLLTWQGALDADFVLDDHPVIVEQEGHMLGPDAVSRALGAVRPVTELTFVLDARMHDMSPRGWHWTNLIIHLLGALALFELVRRCACLVLSRSPRCGCPARLALAVGFVTALLWSVHPIQTEVVSYVVQRSEALAALFGLLALLSLVLCFEQGRSLLWSIPVFILVLLALGSKASAVCLAPMLLLLDWGVLEGSFGKAIRKRWPLHLVAWVLVIAFIVREILFNGLLDATPDQAVGVGLGVRGQDALTYFLAQLEAVPVYLGLIIWPNELLIDRPDRTGLWSTALIPGILFLIAWLAVGLTGLSRGRWWGAVMLMAIIAIMPSSSFIPVADVIVEHRLYLPLAPLAVLLTGGLVGVLLAMKDGGFAPSWLPVSLVALFLVVIVSLSAIRTHARNLDYASPGILWTQVLVADTGNVRARINYSSELLREGRHQEALPYIEEILATHPSNLQAHINAGIVLLALDQPVEALIHLRIAEETYSGHPSMHAALGDAERSLGNLESAEYHFKRVIERQPSDARTCLVLANVLQEQGRLEESIEYQEIAIGILQGGADRELLHSALMNRGSSAFQLERWAEAADYYREAMATAPTEVQRQRIGPYFEAATVRSTQIETGEQQDQDDE